MKHIMLFLKLSLLAGSLFAQSQWQAIPNAPSNQGRFDDVFFVDSLHGWLAGSAGRIYRTSDGGVNWTQVYNSNYYFRSIEFFNQQIGYAGTLDKKLLRTTNGGNTWTNISASISPAPDAVCGIAIPDSMTIYAVGEWDTPGYVAKTSDGGHTWVRQTLGKAMVDADLRALECIVRNLLQNALLHGHASQVQFDITNGHNAKINLRVSDNGKGVSIPRATLGKLFGRHYPGSGNGIGLYLIRRLTERMGGKLSFPETKEGHGFIVDLELPGKLV